MWGTQITSVTMPSILEQFELKDWNDLTENEKPNSIIIEISPNISYTIAGPKFPYLGGMTKKKITQGLIQVTERNFDSAPIQDIVQLLGWIQADPISENISLVA